jgi:iron complex outermembrane receptor protein
MSTIQKRACLAGALTLLFLPRFAAAQTQTQNQNQTPTETQTPAQTAAAKSADAATPPARSEEITVTATRRASSISRVPLSVSAYTQQTLDLKGARTIEDVVRFTPGVSFDPTTNNISIRGISSEAGAGTTGIYIDDTPVQVRNLGFNAENSVPELFDLDRVEVLRGPQGTLFGAGSEGGTVRYITPQPGLENYSAYGRSSISASADGSPSYDAGFALGGPLIKDRLGFRISVSHETDGGYLDHLDAQTGNIVDRNTNTTNINVYRGALAIAPVDGLLITPAIMFQSRLKGDTDAYFEGLSDPSAGQFRTNSPEYVKDNDRFYLPSLNIKYALGPVDLISNTSYLHRDNLTGYNGTIYNLSFYNTYLDDSSPYYPLLLPTGVNPALPAYISPSRITNQQRNVTQEVRIQSNDPGARFVWTAGVFYQHNEQLSSEQIEDPVANSLFLPVFGDTISDFFGAPLYGKDSYINQTHAVDEQEAVFADGTYRIVDGLKFDAGLRYAHTDFSFDNFAAGSQNGGTTGGSGGKAEDPVTPKFTLSWQVTPRDLVYVTWAKGYRVGGASPPVPVEACATDLADFGIASAPDQYGSDTVKSWEIGSKNRLFDDRVELGLSAYTIDWDNIQQSVLLPTCGIRYTTNLGKAVSRGFDAQALLRPAPGVTIDTAFGFTDAHYTTDSNAGTAAGSGLIARDGDSIGDPAWKFSIGAQYTAPRGRFTVLGAQPYLRADYQYVGPPSGTTPLRDALTATYDPGYVRTDATNFISLRAGLIFRRAFNLSVFVNNLLNATPRLTQEHETIGSPLYYDTTLTPRYVGMMLTYRD